MNNRLSFVTVVILGSWLGLSEGFTNGAPPLKAVCQNMLPQHNNNKAQTSAAPYQITTNVNQLNGGDELKVTISPTDSATKIRGFYIQVRDSQTNLPIGTFLANGSTNILSCLGKRMNAATHNNGKLVKDGVEIAWKAPADFNGDVKVIATVLSDFNTFWSNVQSGTVTIK